MGDNITCLHTHLIFFFVTHVKETTKKNLNKYNGCSDHFVVVSLDTGENYIYIHTYIHYVFFGYFYLPMRRLEFYLWFTMQTTHTGNIFGIYLYFLIQYTMIFFFDNLLNDCRFSHDILQETLEGVFYVPFFFMFLKWL